MEALALRPLLVAAPRPPAFRMALVRFVLATLYRRECAEIDKFTLEAVSRLQTASAPADVPVLLDDLQLLPSHPGFLRAWDKLARAARWLPAPRDVASRFRRLGAPAAHHIALGYAYSEHVPKDVLDDLRDLDVATPGCALIYDDSLPLEAAEAALKASRVMCALLVLAEQLQRRTLAPWLIMDLAERFSDGCRAALQIVAAVWPDRVSEDVLPRQHRLSSEALNSQTASAFDDLPVHSSLPEDGDE